MALLAPTVGILLLFALVNGQLTPGPAPGCDDARVQAGDSLMAHEKYGRLYYSCDGGLNRFEMQCGPGTLFDGDLMVCVAPAQAKVKNWQCDATTIGRNYPDPCCTNYWQCVGSGLEEKSCDEGQSFDIATGQCRAGSSCEDHKYCQKSGSGEGEPWTCLDYESENGDPCVYDTRLPDGRVYKSRPCPYGTAYNRTACQCSTLSQECPLSMGLAENKVLDSECRASLKMDFESLPLHATSEKMGNIDLPYQFKSVGVAIVDGKAVFRTDPNSGSAYIYGYYALQNALTPPVGHSILFQRDQTPTTSNTFTLLTNNYNNVCSPTLEVNVTYSGNTVQLQASVVGTTTLSVLSQTLISGTATGSLNLQNANNWVQVDLKFDGTLYGTLYDRGSAGTSPKGNGSPLTASAVVGTHIASTRCGLTLLKGFTGKVDRYYMYEGCGDLGRVGNY